MSAEQQMFSSREKVLGSDRVWPIFVLSLLAFIAVIFTQVSWEYGLVWSLGGPVRSGRLLCAMPSSTVLGMFIKSVASNGACRICRRCGSA